MHRPSLVLVAAILVFAKAARGQQGISPQWPLRDSAIVTVGASAIVVSGHPIASGIGRDILRRGGNAVDAAVAVGFALAVTHPQAGNLGGGGFMVIRQKTGETVALDYREVAPRRATRNMFLDAGGNPTHRSWTGHLASGVPGAVAGLYEAHRRFGKLPWADVVEPAVALARDGFVVDEYRSQSILSDSARLTRFPASRKSFLPGGTAPQPGSTWRQPDLARTLDAIRLRGAAGFYQGPVALLIEREMRRGGGIISRADLRRYKPVWREPIRFTYRGYTVYSMPPVSSGGVTLAMILNQMEGFESLPPFGSPELMHLEAEAMRRAFMERNTRVADPAFVKVPVALLTSKDFAAKLRATIDPAHATPTPPFNAKIHAGTNTTHYSVVDADGNAVSTTTTLNNSYGSAVTVTGGGFLMNDEMDDFATAPGKPNAYGLVEGEANAIAPGKRILSSMTPSLVLDPEGKLFMVVGTPGGPTIITQVYHIISNVLDHRMALAAAVSAPRLHHQALPDQIYLERDGFLPEAIERLHAMGHQVVVRDYSGDVEAIIRIAGGWQGVSDPRRGGGGAGY
ncbi:MAG: gamma-glutamyltransferase [Gemmatimonadota bacterium]